MRWVFTFISCLFFLLNSQGQSITGIWRGYFSSSNGLYREGIQEEMYKYEIQIDQQPNNGIKGVTYSYKTTVFYGKATFQGIYNVKSKTIILKETGLVDLKIGDKSEPCLITCYLDYSKMGKLEVLQGTFISINIKDKGDCGNGKVYLERVPDSDFEKEDFLKKNATAKSKKGNLESAKKETETAKFNKPKETLTGKNSPTGNNLPKPSNKLSDISGNTNTGKSNNIEKSNNAGKTNSAPVKKAAPTVGALPVTPAEPPVIQTMPQRRAEESNSSSVKREQTETETREKKQTPLPKVLVERENKLVKTIQVEDENIQIDLFDNGTIDNDTISVFHNNKLVIKHGRLAFNPISLKIKCSPEDKLHELVVVAENLGEIPPNTALMVITAGKKRYEVFLSSNESRNAKVIIEFAPRN